MGRNTCALLALIAGLSGCAQDKKIPPPPQGTLVDVSHPYDMARPRELLEHIPEKSGYARKVAAYHTPEACSSAADFYAKFMRDARWTELSLSQPKGSGNPTDWNPAGLNEFSQSWQYMSRHAYITGAAGKDGSGCTVMTAIYDKARRRRYQEQ